MLERYHIQGSHRLLRKQNSHDFSMTISKLSMTVSLLKFCICDILWKKMEEDFLKANFLNLSKKYTHLVKSGGKFCKIPWLITKFHDILPIFHCPWLFHEHSHFPTFPGTKSLWEPCVFYTSYQSVGVGGSREVTYLIPWRWCDNVW